MTLPRHVAIVMDGNGRWAAARGLPRHAGHKEGVAPVRMSIEECARRGIEALTLFAFSSENWRRPEIEVSSLMGLFLDALDREVDELHRNSVRLRFIGERGQLSMRLQSRMAAAVVSAARELARECLRGALRVDEISEERFSGALSLSGLPDPDLFIRTGGEHRISNFLLWNLAYTELWFTDRLWPEFDVGELERALAYFASRERRFGRTAALKAGARA
jgi:undecaprenyl diphosphate synthase